MPQIKIEYTDNLPITHIEPIVTHIHNFLVAKLPTQIEACKTRVEKHSQYFIADGDPKNAFFHLEIKILQGRSTDLLSQIGMELQIFLKHSLSYLPKDLNTQISIEIAELGNVYMKTVL